MGHFTCMRNANIKYMCQCFVRRSPRTPTNPSPPQSQSLYSFFSPPPQKHPPAEALRRGAELGTSPSLSSLPLILSGGDTTCVIGTNFEFDVNGFLSLTSRTRWNRVLCGWVGPFNKVSTRIDIFELTSERVPLFWHDMMRYFFKDIWWKYLRSFLSL